MLSHCFTFSAFLWVDVTVVIPFSRLHNIHFTWRHYIHSSYVTVFVPLSAFSVLISIGRLNCLNLIQCIHVWWSTSLSLLVNICVLIFVLGISLCKPSQRHLTFQLPNCSLPYPSRAESSRTEPPVQCVRAHTDSGSMCRSRGRGAVTVPSWLLNVN